MKEHRRPAGVDPTVIAPPASLDAEARAIGRRVEAKVFALVAGDNWPGDPTPEMRAEVIAALGIAEIVEAEIGSIHGTPPSGVVELRLGYDDALTLATAIVEAEHTDRSATERDILAKLREKIFEALGLPPSC